MHRLILKGLRFQAFRCLGFVQVRSQVRFYLFVLILNHFSGSFLILRLYRGGGGSPEGKPGDATSVTGKLAP
jgi:hypothetical protein